MSNSPVPSEPGDLPTKVVFLGVAAGSGAAQPLYNRIAGEVSAFLLKARQNRLISGQQGAHMIQARPGGGSFRYQYNNGLEVIYVTLSAPEVTFSREPQPPPEKQSLPQLAIDVVFEPELFDSEDLRHVDRITTPGGGGTAGDYRTWDFARYVPAPRVAISSGYPVTGIEYVAPKPGGGPDETQLFTNGRQDYAGGGGDLVLYGNSVDVGAAVYNAVQGTLTYEALELLLENFGLAGRTRQTNAGAGTTDFGYSALLSLISASAASAPTATWAIVYAPFSANFTYPNGPPLGTYAISIDSIPPVEFYCRPDGFRDVNAQRKVERFDVRNMVAVIAGPTDDTPYKSVSPGMTTPPTEDKRLRYLDPDDADYRVDRELDAHTARGAPGTFGAGFLADMKNPGSARIGEPTQFDIYVASVNSTAKNTAPGPVGGVDVDSAGVTRDVDPVLRIRIRARELNGAKAKIAATTSSINSKMTVVDQDGTEVTYSDEPREVEVGGDGGGTITIPGTTESIEWAFAVLEGWVDLGGEPSDPTAKAMGALLADSKAIMPSVTGPADKATHFYGTLQWNYPIESMTKIAELTWTPAKSFADVGQASIKLLV